MNARAWFYSTGFNFSAQTRQNFADLKKSLDELGDQPQSASKPMCNCWDDDNKGCNPVPCPVHSDSDWDYERQPSNGLPERL